MTELCSIIRQKNSHSRLSVSENLFEKVSTTCGFSAHFKDALAYFGSRDLEVEVAAPRLRFALLNSQQSLTSGGGFGMNVSSDLKVKLINVLRVHLRLAVR